MKTEENATSLGEILETIDDDKSLRLLNFLAGNHRTNTDNDSHMAQLNMTHKEYYSRMSKFIKAGLVRRRQRKYLLTSFGAVIHELYSVLGEVIERKIRPE